jgi:hypothetical protein
MREIQNLHHLINKIREDNITKIREVEQRSRDDSNDLGKQISALKKLLDSTGTSLIAAILRLRLNKSKIGEMEKEKEELVMKVESYQKSIGVEFSQLTPRPNIKHVRISKKGLVLALSPFS